jgi:hypothetical protein
LIVDIVPHKLYEHLSLKQLKDMVGQPPFMWIAEFITFLGLIDRNQARDHPGNEDEPTLGYLIAIASAFAGRYIVCRFGMGNISDEVLFDTAIGPCGTSIRRDTGYQTLPENDKPGFGDRLTAELIRRITMEPQ